MFCAPEAAGQGIASRLYDAVEAAAREQRITSASGYLTPEADSALQCVYTPR
jgi:GNAT superfamily N-acetyltransferase